MKKIIFNIFLVCTIFVIGVNTSYADHSPSIEGDRVSYTVQPEMGEEVKLWEESPGLLGDIDMLPQTPEGEISLENGSLDDGAVYNDDADGLSSKIPGLSFLFLFLIAVGLIIILATFYFLLAFLGKVDVDIDNVNQKKGSDKKRKKRKKRNRRYGR